MTPLKTMPEKLASTRPETGYKTNNSEKDKCLPFTALICELKAVATETESREMGQAGNSCKRFTSDCQGNQVKQRLTESSLDLAGIGLMGS